MIIIPARQSDIPDITKIHIDTFKSFFLSNLGSSFIKTYYNAYLGCDDSLILVIKLKESDKLIGFAAGTIKSKGYHKRLILKNLPSFIHSGIRIIFTNPPALLRLLKNLDKRSNKEDNGEYAELLSIAIHPQFAGKGAGTMVLKEFERNVKERGSKCLALTTDFDGNENTIKFYESCGYQVLNQFISYPKRKMYKLIKQL